MIIVSIGSLLALVVCIAFVSYSLGRRQVVNAESARSRTKNTAATVQPREKEVEAEADHSPSIELAPSAALPLTRMSDRTEIKVAPDPTSNEITSVGSPTQAKLIELESEAPSGQVRPQPVESTAATPPREQPAVLPTRTVPRPQVPPASAETPQELVTLFQYLDIKRNPSFNISGLATTSQNIHYQVLSKLTVDPSGDEETQNVTQIVEDTRLLAADDLSRKTFEKSLANLKGRHYMYKLNKRGAVIEFTGHKRNLAALAVDLVTSKGFQITSVIDEDGWKELAELTFLVPDPQSQSGDPWQRQMTHDWGELGGWSGMTTFAWNESNSEERVIDFVHKMRYIKPDGGGGRGLPIKISDATFTPQEAGGRIRFDPEKNRVTRAREVFQVTGNISAELLGQTVPLQVTERQLIEIRITDQRVDTQ